jgi:hypothetical protein
MSQVPKAMIKDRTLLTSLTFLYSNGSSIYPSVTPRVHSVYFSSNAPASYYDLILGKGSASDESVLKYRPKNRASQSKRANLVREVSPKNQRPVNYGSILKSAVHMDEYSTYDDEKLWASMETRREHIPHVLPNVHTSIPDVIRAFEASDKGGRNCLLLIRRIFDIAFSPLGTLR